MLAKDGTFGRLVFRAPVLVSLGLAACHDGVSPSRVEVRLFVEPAEAHATLMTGVNAGTCA